MPRITWSSTTIAEITGEASSADPNESTRKNTASAVTNHVRIR
jgi:hypothetical protein